MNISRTQLRQVRPERFVFSERTVTSIASFAIAILAIMSLTPGSARAAGTFYVDNTSGACSNNGPGTEAQPYCTIVAALTKQGGPGTTILVKAGTYREQVTVPVSGAPGSPLVIRAVGTVVIDGADPFGDPSLWTQFAGDVWLSPITWSPLQVLLNGARLTPSADDPASLPSMSFRYVAGEGLYVNVGGGNPGDHPLRVGHRLNGFKMNGKSWVTIEDFIVTQCDEKGFELEGGAANCEIRNNQVDLCASSGISLFGGADVIIEFNRVTKNQLHGIELRGGSTACMIRDNESSWNVDPAPVVATGIYLHGSPDNRIERNRIFHNGDSGIEIQNGSDNCISIQNVAYQNGDHGFEHLFSVGTINIGNVAYGNATDGFSVEGEALGTHLYNCIATDNGLGLAGFNLYADTTSTGEMDSDYNIFWNSTSQKPIKYRGVQYATVAAYSIASGLDANSLQADPMFVGATNGLFHLQPGSPAIDSGTSGVSYWPATDAQNLPREDDPATPNTGAGPIAYADRGAFEHHVSAVGVGEPVASSGISLSGAYPNPGRGPVAFLLDLPRGSEVEWSVFDLQGRRLGGGQGWQPAGRSLVRWSETGDAAGGVRFARFAVEGQSFTRRFVTIR